MDASECSAEKSGGLKRGVGRVEVDVWKWVCRVFYAGMKIGGPIVGDLVLFFVISGDKLPEFC